MSVVLKGRKPFCLSGDTDKQNTFILRPLRLRGECIQFYVLYNDLLPRRGGRIPLPLPTGRQALPARTKSTLRLSGPGSGQRLRVDPEQGFFAPSCKAGLGATEWVDESSFYVGPY